MGSYEYIIELLGIVYVLVGEVHLVHALHNGFDVLLASDLDGNEGGGYLPVVLPIELDVADVIVWA